MPKTSPDLSELHVCCQNTRAGNSLIGFLSKSLVFAKKWANERFAQKNERLAHFWWATWAIRSWLLIFGEQPEQIPHGRSFLVNNLSDLLTVAHLSWAIWANRSQSLIWFERNEGMSNERMSDERMSKFPAQQGIQPKYMFTIYTLHN